MSITQTLEIPSDRRILVPQEITTKTVTVVWSSPVNPKRKITEEEEIEIINRNAEELNKQAMDSFLYQADLF